MTEPTVSFTMSDTVAELTEALALAGPNFLGLSADRENPHFQARYATLGNIIGTVRVPLAEQGLVVVQAPHVYPGEPTLVSVATRLMHKSGEWLEATVTLSSGTPGPQPVGSALTYARRYGLSCVLLLAVDREDDDGNTAQAAYQQATEAQRARIGIVQAKKMVMAALDGSAALARRFWREQVDPEATGPFPEGMVASLVDDSRTWLELLPADEITAARDEDLAAAQANAPAIGAGVGPQTPPAPETPVGAPTPADQPGEGTNPPSDPEATADGRPAVDAGGRVDGDHPAADQIEQWIAEAQTMTKVALCRDLAGWDLSTAGNLDTIRLRWVRHLAGLEQQS